MGRNRSGGCVICTVSIHTSHPEILNRLKRAYGHLRSVITMIEEHRPCTATAQQFHADESRGSETETDILRKAQEGKA